MVGNFLLGETLYKLPEVLLNVFLCYLERVTDVLHPLWLVQEVSRVLILDLYQFLKGWGVRVRVSE